MNRFNTASGKYCCNTLSGETGKFKRIGFNTASGKYCCNLSLGDNERRGMVSIPQAVSTVAIAGPRNPLFMGLKIRF